ncbi:MAG: 23S rRNA (adenine(2503)-C(2))-methyltransferase RlmN [Planctomycetota bacterium]
MTNQETVRPDSRGPGAIPSMGASASIYDTAAINALRRELRFEPGLLRRMRIAFFKHFRGAAAALDALPAGVRSAFAERVDFHPLRLHKRCDSRADGASKLIFRTRAGMLIEAVLLRAQKQQGQPGRVALCVSSQVGCAAACDFCATGKMGMAHNLSAAEVLDQVVQANEQLAPEGRSVRNLVFMGMGEPLHNAAAVHEAIAALTDPTLFHHPPSRILVSTVGVADAMAPLARAFPGINLALSLHSVRQATRERIIPLAKRYPLDRLRETLVEVQRVQRRQLMIEYLMLAGVNDSLDEAAELIDWLRGDGSSGGGRAPIDAHVNLIPYNRVPNTPHLVGSDRPTREAFAGVLKHARLPTTLRYSMGADIEAACGQLVRQENRAVAAAAVKSAAKPRGG